MKDPKSCGEWSGKVVLQIRTDLMALDLPISREGDVTLDVESDDAEVAEIELIDNLALGIPEGFDVWPLDCLSMVPFDSLKHANGYASDIPAMLTTLALESHDRVKVDEVINELSSLLMSRGTLYNSTTFTVPFLAHIFLICPTTETKLEVLRFLVSLVMCSSDTYFPQVKRKVARASVPLVSALKFSPLEPSVKNLSACFFALVAPPEDENGRAYLARLFEPALKTTHPKFRLLAQTVHSVLLRNPVRDLIDLEQLETDLFESAEEWECQDHERAKLLTLCRAASFRRLPSDVQRSVKQFLFVAVRV